MKSMYWNLENIWADNKTQTDMIVFSHLRWGFVKQRPQHLLERFAKDRKIIFIEEPIPYTKDNYGTAEILNPAENITVVQPRINENNFLDLYNLLNTVIPNDFSLLPLLWFYSPAFVEILNYLKYSLVIFDCMDELSNFKGAPKELVDKEKVLLSLADVVFTGGKSLFESKSKKHKEVYCFPSSVDKDHFSKALLKKTQTPLDMETIKSPIVGYYGVIDERIDYKLIRQLALLMPKVSFVMIGPVVKVSEDDLPERENIYYLGNKNYQDLPNYLKSFDIAFMPFALNKATKFISPTKTLEYMAAYKPIVSTPIYDVARDYSQVVKLASNAIEMNRAIKYYLKETPSQRNRRISLQRKIIKQTSWDLTVNKMIKIITNLQEQKQKAPAKSFSQSRGVLVYGS